jgi:S-adenosylmethionine hydrolase
MRRELAFTSDFGLSDPYVGEVKGVIHACEPEVRITDITHDIEPGGLVPAAFVLLNAYPYFSRGTVHLAVVDPGVGGGRDILIVTTRNYRFVGPDNGILYEAVRRDGVESIHALDPPAFISELKRVYGGDQTAGPVVGRILRSGASAVFHGRDLFAPLAAYLAGRAAPADERFGADTLSRFAAPRETMAKVEIGEPIRDRTSLLGKIVYVDRFGNLVSNIRAEAVAPEDEIFIGCGGSMHAVGKLRRAYVDAERGSALPLIGSRGYLEIAVNLGSAKDLFGAGCGDAVMILKKGQP